jgi:DNA-binding CsgD family transcriptional regulator
MNKTDRDRLTPREWEVLALIREGLTNEQIADRLGISRDGAKYHVSEILGKLGLSDRIEAAAWYSRNRPTLARFAAFAWPLALLRRLGSSSGLAGLSAGVIIGIAVLILIAVAAGVIIMEGRSSDDPAPPLVQATSTPEPEPTPEELPFAPDGRTGDAAIDDIIDDFLSMDAVELEATFGELMARDTTIDGHPSLAASEWIPRLVAAERSLYSAYRESRTSGVIPPREANFVLSIRETDGRVTGWSLAVDNGQVVDFIIGESPAAYTPDIGFNHERFLVLPPPDQLPQPPPFNGLTTRTGDADVDNLIGLVGANDAVGLLDLVEPAVAIRDCSGSPTQNDVRAAELIRSVAEKGIGLHAVAVIPDGYQPTANHSLIFVVEDSRYVWSGVSLVERDGRIVGLDTCPDYAIHALYPPRANPVPPLTDLNDLDTSRRSGVGVIDTFLDALAAGDIATMDSLVDYEQQGCIVEPAGIGGPPFCEEDEAEGTILDVLLMAQCEGFYQRRENMPSTLQDLAEGTWALYAVADLGPPSQQTEFLRGSYVAVVVDPVNPPPGPFINGLALSFNEVGLTAIRYPCGQSDPDDLVWTGGSPDFLLPPP